MPALSHSELTAAFDIAFAALLRDAVARLGYNAGQDIPAEVYLRADAAYRTFDPQSDHPDLRARQTIRWLMRIQRNLIIDIKRGEHTQRRTARTESLDAWSETGQPFAELCWAAVKATKDRDEERRAEILHEARLRLRYAELSEEERNCLFGKLNGQKLREIATQAHLSTTTVWRRIESAIAALQAVDLEKIESADLDKYQYGFTGVVTLYRAPTSVGSNLTRERLLVWDKKAFRV